MVTEISLQPLESHSKGSQRRAAQHLGPCTQISVSGNAAVLQQAASPVGFREKLLHLAKPLRETQVFSQITPPLCNWLKEGSHKFRVSPTGILLRLQFHLQVPMTTGLRTFRLGLQVNNTTAL